MSQIDVRDVRDERYVRLMRAWIILQALGENTKFSTGVPLPKAAFVDFMLCNPAAQQKLHEHFGRKQNILNLDDFLYQDNVEFGGLQDTKAFAITCIILINGGQVEFIKTGGELNLRCASALTYKNSYLLDRWLAEIKLLLPLLGKSLNVLHTSILTV